MTVMEAIDIPAKLTAFGSDPAPGVATVMFQSKRERLVRVATGLGIGWGLALVSVFIPVAHFILVPAFFAMGIGLAVLRAREDVRLLKLSGTCPRCGRTQEFKVGGRLTPGRVLDCPACHNNLVLVADLDAHRRA